MANDNLANHASQAGAGAGGPAEKGVADAELTDEQRMELRRRSALAAGVDDADGAHGGGIGVQDSAVDFGKPKNFGLPE